MILKKRRSLSCVHLKILSAVTITTICNLDHYFLSDWINAPIKGLIFLHLYVWDYAAAIKDVLICKRVTHQAQFICRVLLDYSDSTSSFRLKKSQFSIWFDLFSFFHAERTKMWYLWLIGNIFLLIDLKVFETGNVAKGSSHPFYETNTQY